MARANYLSHEEREKRRDAIVAQHNRGSSPHDIATRHNLTVNYVRAFLKECGTTAHADVHYGNQVDPIWDADEDVRRIEMARRAAEGARATRIANAERQPGDAVSHGFNNIHRD